MYADRLERLAKLLDDDAANEKGVKFDLGVWAGPSDMVNRTFPGQPETVPVSCETTACAMGLAAISREFAAEGLDYKFDPRFSGGYILLPTMMDRDGELQEGFGAAQELFGISYDDATYLFDPEHYDEVPTGADGERFVAQRIRDFVKGDIDDEFYG
jgi:hypothetical protein